MAEGTRYAELAARMLRQRAPSPESRMSRDVGVSAVAHAMALRKRQRGIRALVGGTALAVAAMVALFAAWSHSRGELRATPACVGSRCAPAPDRVAAANGSLGHALSRGERLVAPPGQATTVVLASGTHITLDQDGALECREDTATQRFAVLRGRARLKVAKLQAGERFLVETPNAELEVRGTAFSVRIDPATPACATRTSVEVEEGAVEVRSEGGRLLLHPGERWANACVQTNDARTASGTVSATASTAEGRGRAGGGHPLPVPAVPAPAPTPASQPPAPTPTVSPAPPTPSALPVSALTEQNDLYARAQLASREGRSEEALSAFGRLLALFPSGQLAENASVQRVRLLAVHDNARAQAEAKGYLLRYPAGFARREMEALSGAP